MAESRGVENNLPKNLVVTPVSAHLYKNNVRLPQPDLLINIQKSINFSEFIKNDEVINMLDEKSNVCYGCIYLIENIQNHKKYIGYTTYEHKEYIQNHFKKALSLNDISENNKNGKYFYNAIRKYGVHNFIWRILGYCYSFEELCESEKEAIYFYRSFGADGEHEDNIYGYNRTKGGEGTCGPKTEEAKKNISKGKIGNIPWNKGLTKNTDIRLKQAGEKIALLNKTKIKKSKKVEKVCPTCGNNFMTYGNIYCSQECYHFNQIAWNKGLTKETNESVKLGAEKLSTLKKGGEWTKNRRKAYEKRFLNKDNINE